MVSVRVRARVNPNPSPEQVDFPMHKYIKSLRGLISGLVTSPLL